MLPNRLLRARRLFIRNVTITAPIGAYEHEKKAPQRLILSCDVWVPDTPVCRDSLDEVLNYDQIVDVLKNTALARHHDLQETLVAEIAERLGELARKSREGQFAHLAAVGGRRVVNRILRSGSVSIMRRVPRDSHSSRKQSVLP